MAMEKHPPFRLAGLQGAIATALGNAGPDALRGQGAGDDEIEASSHGRTRLGDLDAYLHCSVIGTCLSTVELRRLMCRFIEVDGFSDLFVHHETVRQISLDAATARALSKALDRRHEATLRRFARAGSVDELATLWQQALQQGDVPGAYWAALTSRLATHELRQQVYGDVHMLSHLVGASNRADIRRLVALETENADLRERLERQQARSSELAQERTCALEQVRRLEAQAAAWVAVRAAEAPGDGAEARRERVREIEAAIALQSERRERAERIAAAAEQDSVRVKIELHHLRNLVHDLEQELEAAEAQLHEVSDPVANAGSSSSGRLRGRRILYVGGRSGTTPAMRELVRRRGGEFRRHDGGLEDRKGLLAAAVAWAHWVLFPVDCVDHDSANNLKRICTQQSIRFVPLRSAGVGSFAAAIASLADEADPGAATDALVWSRGIGAQRG
jgi:hypothetical protein